MATRVVEGKKPYTGGKAISIDENKVISLNLRDENNLIIYDSGDDEIYVDLQLPDGIEPTDAFPVGVTTGRVLVADDWDITGTIICAKTTSGDNIKLLYGDDGTLWIDNGTGTFKQIYFKADVDALLLALRQYIDTELAKKQDVLTAGEGIDITNNTVSNTLPGPTVSSSAPANPSQGDMWYDTTNDRLMTYDGTNWNVSGGSGGTGDVVGPNSATDGHLAVFDGATGKIIKDGGAVPTGFEPDNAGSTDQVLTKTANGYEWSAPSGGSSTITVTLAAANWSSQSITVTATGVTASNTVIVSPAPANINDYAINSVYCSAQGSNTLTFSCNTEPTVDIDVNVLIMS